MSLPSVNRRGFRNPRADVYTARHPPRDGRIERGTTCTLEPPCSTRYPLAALIALPRIRMRDDHQRIWEERSLRDRIRPIRCGSHSVELDCTASRRAACIQGRAEGRLRRHKVEKDGRTRPFEASVDVFRGRQRRGWDGGQRDFRRDYRCGRRAWALVPRTRTNRNPLPLSSSNRSRGKKGTIDNTTVEHLNYPSRAPEIDCTHVKRVYPHVLMARTPVSYTQGCRMQTGRAVIVWNIGKSWEDRRRYHESKDDVACRKPFSNARHRLHACQARVSTCPDGTDTGFIHARLPYANRTRRHGMAYRRIMGRSTTISRIERRRSMSETLPDHPTSIAPSGLRSWSERPSHPAATLRECRRVRDARAVCEGAYARHPESPSLRLGCVL